MPTIAGLSGAGKGGLSDTATPGRSSAPWGNAKTPARVATYMNGAGTSPFAGKGSKGATVGTVTVAPVTSQGFTQVISVNAIKGRLGRL